MQTVLDAVKGEGQWASSGKLTSSAGNVAVVARRLNVHPETVRNYMKRWRTVADAVRAERRFLVEMAENKALEKVMDGDTAMIIFTLKAHPESDWSEKSRTETDVHFKDGSIPVQFVDYRAGLEGDDPAEAEG